MVPELTDQSIMPFGEHKGKKLANVPAGYLLWAYVNLTLFDNMKAYINKNRNALEAENKRANQQMRR